MNSKTLHTNTRNKGKKHTNDIPILRERLEQLRKDNGYTQKEVAKKIGCSYESYQAWINPRYQGFKEDYTYVTPSIDKLMALSDLYGVSIDYLVGKTDYTSVDNEMISNVTGLTDDSIENIKDIIDSDLEYNITIDKVKKQSNGAVNIPYLNTIDNLNVLLSSDYLETILIAVGNFMNNGYNIPVHYQETKPHVKPGWYVDNQNIFVSDYNCIALAKNTNDLGNNKMIPINDTFLETIALKDIEKALYEIKKGCP